MIRLLTIAFAVSTLAVSTLAVSTLAGCARTRPVPLRSLDDVRVRIEQADALAPAGRARAELRLAEDRLRSAEAAATAGLEERARRFAEQALVHADIAETIALCVRAEDVLKEIQETTQALRDEIERVNPPGR